MFPRASRNQSRISTHTAGGFRAKKPYKKSLRLWSGPTFRSPSHHHPIVKTNRYVHTRCTIPTLVPAEILSLRINYYKSFDQHNKLTPSKQSWLEANPVVLTPLASCAPTERTRNGPIFTTRSVLWALLSSPLPLVVLPTPRVLFSRRLVLRPSSPTPLSESAFVYN